MLGSLTILKGSGIYAFVTLKAGVDFGKMRQFQKSSKSTVREAIKPKFLLPDHIQITPSPAKKRSGKIMGVSFAKLLKIIFDLGDTSTLPIQQ
ncbi:MAG: hypothetical protein CM15mP111_3880 [Hyphomicrobiales bacterium]|nr:MAG: hypothetical protein CM15mP111_3880 [Hyphomicrobiales bacterium]